MNWPILRDGVMRVLFEENDGAGGGEGGVATPGAGGVSDTGGADDGGGQTAGGANLTGEGLPAGGAAGGAGISHDTALPADLAEKLGVKTIGELAGGFTTMKSAAQQFRDYARALQEKANATGNPTDQVKADAAKAEAFRLAPYGFKDEKSFNTAWAANPRETLVDMIEKISEAKAQALFEKNSKPIVDEVQQHSQERFQRETQAIEGRWTQQHDALGKADARFAAKGADGKPGPLYAALQKQLDQHGGYFRQAAAADPNFNPYEMAAEMVLGAVARSGQQNSEQRLELANNISGAARPGTGGGVVPKNNGAAESPRDTINRVNAELQAAGKPTMNAGEMEALEASLSKFGF